MCNDSEKIVSDVSPKNSDAPNLSGNGCDNLGMDTRTFFRVDSAEQRHAVRRGTKDMTMHANVAAMVVGTMLLTAGVAFAGEPDDSAAQLDAPVVTPLVAAASTLARPVIAQDSAPAPVAFEYSDAYRLRGKIHRIASFATLPLFATEGYLGQSIYNAPSSSKKSAHLAVASGIGALFAVNTVTGVWNLVEGRKDPSHRKRRLVHGILMLAADGGFLATAMLGPESEHGIAEGSRSMHRAVAFSSIGAASVGYLIMLFGNH